MPEAKEFREGDWQCPNAACVNHTDFPQHYVYGAKVARGRREDRARCRSVESIVITESYTKWG
eukprot:944410-Amphidinium_carterae.1